jgi:hypothetical protein
MKNGGIRVPTEFKETKVCTTWHLKLLLAIQMKTSSVTLIFNFKSK